MLKVVPPEGWEPPQDATIDADSGSLSSFEDIDQLLTNPQTVSSAATQTKKRSAAKKAKSPKRKRSSVKPATEAKTQAPAPGRPPHKQALPTTAPGSAENPQINPQVKPEVEAPVLPSDAWTSETARKRRKLILMIAGSIGVVVVVTAIIAAIIVNSGDPDTIADQDQTNPQLVDDSERDDSDSNANDQNQSNDNDPDSDDNGGLLDETPTAVTPIPQNVTGNTPAEDPAVQSPFSVPGATTNAETIGDQPPPIDSPNPLVPKGGRFAGGPDMDPTPKQPDSPVEGIMGEADDLGDLASLLQSSNTSMADLQDVTIGAGNRHVISKYFITPPKETRLSTERQLELEIGRLAYKKPVPFSQTVRTISDLSGLPVTVDARQLALHGHEIDPLIAPEINELSMLDALAAIGKDRGLTPVLTESGVILTIEVNNELVVSSLDFPNIPGLDANAKQKFVGAIQSLVAPSQWVDEANPSTVEVVNDKIEVKCRLETKLLIEQFIQKLEAAATLIEQPDHVEARTVVASRWSSSEALRQSPSKFKPGGSRTIGKFFNRVKKMSGLTVLVDWHRLMGQGWTPSTLIPGNVSEPTTEELVQEVANSMRMELIAVDAKTLVITTPEQAKWFIDLEVYPINSRLAKEVTNDGLQELVFQLLGNQVNDHFVRVVYEPRCQCLIAVGPQSIQRQIEGVVDQLNR